MTEQTEPFLEETDAADGSSLIDAFEKTLEISQDVKLPQCFEEKNSIAADCPSTEDSSDTPSKWTVGAHCLTAWSQDGLVYPATVVSLDGERCRVRFSSYGNEEDVDVSALRTPLAQDWMSGSRCRAVYSEDGLVYPAVVLWVKGQRCRIRFDGYDNEEELDISSLLNPDELHGRTSSKSSWKSTAANIDWKRRRREDQRGDRKWSSRGDQPWVKERPASHTKETGNQTKDGQERPTHPSSSLFPPFPAPQLGSGEPVSFVPPPLWTLTGTDSSGSLAADSASSMLMLWYMCGFHTGSYMAQQQFRSKD